MRVLLVLAFFAALFSVASASHYRYGTIYWETTGTNTVNFTIETAWRKSYWPAGTTVGSTLALQSFYFGDGTSASSFSSVVTTVNNLEDWVISIAFITHTYKTPANGNAPWTAYFTNNARIGNLRNNANQPWFLTTTVDASLVGSPRSKMLPIANVLLLQNNITTFNVPAVTDDNSQIHYTMGTATQICGPGKSCTNPPKMTVDASSGTVTWDLSTITPGLWTAVIMISNDRVSVPVDFIINYTRVAGQCASNCSKPGTTCFLPSDCGNCPSTNQCVKPQPPSICNPTPSNKVPYAANFGTPISFNISAVDAQPNAKVFIQEGSLPATATLSPPMGTNPVVRTFSWLPETEGASIFCFSATDSNMLTTPQYCITIEVSLGCSPACEGYADCIKGACVCQQGYSGANCSVFGGDIVDGETAFGSVAMHGSNFYSFMPIAGNAIKIILETVESSYSTALFVSTTVQQPTITSKTWGSIAEDPNSIVITPTDPNYDANATFYLAVFGWYSSFSNMIDYNLTVFLS